MYQTDERAPRGHTRSGTLGFTLIEVMVVMVIMVVAILGFVFGLGASVQDLSASGQSYYALNAARSKVEEMKGRPFGRLYANYGPGSGGETFAVSYEESGKTFTSSRIDFQSRVGVSSISVPPGTYKIILPKYNNWSPGIIQVQPSDPDRVTVNIRLRNGGQVRMTRS